MSNANLFVRLTRLLPSSPTLIGRVVAHSATDDTSTIELFNGTSTQAYAPGVTAGATFTARGRTVAVGLNAFVRDGVVQAQAPTSAPSDVEIGTVVAEPLGPARLAAAAAAPTLANGQIGVAYSASVTGAVTGGYPPRVFTLASGALPAGLSLSTAGVVSGTPTAAGVASFTLLCEDSTRRSVTTVALGLTVS